jgi:uncharacterized membrane protein
LPTPFRQSQEGVGFSPSNVLARAIERIARGQGVSAVKAIGLPVNMV